MSVSTTTAADAGERAAKRASSVTACAHRCRCPRIEIQTRSRSCHRPARRRNKKKPLRAKLFFFFCLRARRGGEEQARAFRVLPRASAAFGNHWTTAAGPMARGSGRGEIFPLKSLRAKKQTKASRNRFRRHRRRHVTVSSPSPLHGPRRLRQFRVLDRPTTIQSRLVVRRRRRRRHRSRSRSRPPLHPATSRFNGQTRLNTPTDSRPPVSTKVLKIPFPSEKRPKTRRDVYTSHATPCKSRGRRFSRRRRRRNGTTRRASWRQPATGSLQRLVVSLVFAKRLCQSSSRAHGDGGHVYPRDPRSSFVRRVFPFPRPTVPPGTAEAPSESSRYVLAVHASDTYARFSSRAATFPDRVRTGGRTLPPTPSPIRA